MDEIIKEAIKEKTIGQLTARPESKPEPEPEPGSKSGYKSDYDANIAARQELVDRLKNLTEAQENTGKAYAEFQEIRRQWREAGPVPKQQYELLKNDYHHHVAHFYELLHLDRELRELDYKHNLEEKEKLISRAEELTREADVHKAFRELQLLHRLWKEETGPVARELSDEVWERFSAVTQIIHDRKDEAQKELDKKRETNLVVKNEIIRQIGALADDTKNEHTAWQKSIKAIAQLKAAFHLAGRVPEVHNKTNWESFRQALRRFNRQKNTFYKDQKKEQFEHLAQKKELIEIAERNRDSENFAEVTPLMKDLQRRWKRIGHVPRQQGEELWQRFRAACNHYFERLHASNRQDREVEQKAFAKKTALLEELKKFEPTGNDEQDYGKLKELTAAWMEAGRVPFKKKDIATEYNKTLDRLLERLNVPKKDAALLKYEHRLKILSEQGDPKKIRNEQHFLSKKISEVEAEIRQLENNMGFFQHVDDDNPMVVEVRGKIEVCRETLNTWKSKAERLKSVS